MPDAPIVQPADPNAAQPPQVQPQEPQPQGGPSLPPDLMKLPAIQAITAGSPPAVSAPLKQFKDRDEAGIIAKHADVLKQAGFGFYKSMSGHLGVVFNSLYIHPADLQAADKAGKLQMVAPDFDAVGHLTAKSGLGHPALARTHVPNSPAGPTPQAAPQSASMGAPAGQNAPGPAPRPAPVGVERRMTAARLANLKPTPATAAPPGGQLLAQILKPVV